MPSLATSSHVRAACSAAALLLPPCSMEAATCSFMGLDGRALHMALDGGLRTLDSS